MSEPACCVCGKTAGAAITVIELAKDGGPPTREDRWLCLAHAADAMERSRERDRLTGDWKPS